MIAGALGLRRGRDEVGTPAVFALQDGEGILSNTGVVASSIRLVFIGD